MERANSARRRPASLEVWVYYVMSEKKKDENVTVKIKKKDLEKFISALEKLEALL
jgi:hypothetical protein